MTWEVRAYNRRYENIFSVIFSDEPAAYRLAEEIAEGYTTGKSVWHVLIHECDGDTCRDIPVEF